MTDHSLSANDLIAYNVLGDWHEAVAIVQSVCLAISDSHANVPDPEQILIRDDGNVTVLPAVASSEPAATRMARTLNALLEGLNAPAELRLLTSQATGTTPLLTSLADFSDRLAYFERPGRPRMLQAIYERAVPAIAGAKAREGGVDRAAQRAAAETSPPRQRVPALTPRQKQMFVMATAIFLAAGVTLWLWRSGAPAAIDAGANKVLEAVGLTDSPDEATETASDGQSGDQTDAGAPIKGGAPRASSTSRKSLGSAAATPSPDGQAQPPGAGASRDAAPAPPAAAHGDAAEAPLAIAPEAVDDGRIYSSDDHDIYPPVLFWPQLPTHMPPDIVDAFGGKEGLVDLLINQKGEVDAVKFLTPPGRFQQRMVISALKAWRYHPALKDGRPVRYMQRVKLTL